MRLADYSARLLALSETLHRWLGALAGLDAARREKIAGYADEIAATLARAAEALDRLEGRPGDTTARRAAMREFGRIAGYVENIVEALQHHLDGRKLAGVKRRLELLSDGPSADPPEVPPSHIRIDRLLAAEGYFRALADGLRV